MLSKIIRKILRESTGSGNSSGVFAPPLQPGIKIFDKSSLAPFEIPVSEYDNAELQFDSYDGKMSTPKKKIKKMEKKSLQISKKNKKYPVSNDEDGGIINALGDTKKKKLKLDDVSSPFKTVNEWVEIDDNIISEDLAVWFGTKKKPKGSKQPKGPWVNICRKKEGGGHPPCGRPEAESKGYPKCRAASVASKMTDAQKRSACQQKRKAEKSKPKSGTGNKPTMVSYKPKTRKEAFDQLVKKLIGEIKN
jgi:hypothetical protein